MINASMKRISPFFILFSVITSSHAAPISLQRVGFPDTIADVPSEIRTEVEAAGYEPFKNAVVYMPIEIESEEKALERELNRLESIRQYDAIILSNTEYCEKYFDEARCPQDRGKLQEIIAIGNNPNTPAQPATGTTTTPATNVVINIPGTATSTTPNTNTAVAQHPSTTITTPTGPVIANNRAHRGPCTPSARSNHFRNKILTSGKYQAIHPAFEKAMIQIFRVEGDCGYHPADRGGYTCYGWAQNSNPDIDVKQLTRAGAEDRTYQRFFLAKGIDKLPDAISGDVLRGDFGSGPGQGIKRLRQTLGLKATRDSVDDELINAVKNYPGDIHNAYWDTMQQFYINITERKPSQKVFLKGWMNGVKHFRDNGCHVQPQTPLTR